MKYDQADEVRAIMADAQRVVVLQADNPDGDSLASSLALEHILGDMGKEVSLYCAIDMPSYLRYLPGWDRVSKDIPANFDAAIIVDASTMTLFEKLDQSEQRGWVASKPVVVLDHHTEVENPVPFAKVVINDPERSSTGEVIYHLAKQLEWPLSVAAQETIATSILADTQGLSNNMAKPETYRVMAALIEAGVNRPRLEETRRAYTKMPESIFRYKARLIDRTELHAHGRLALTTIPQQEITNYSPLYNPGPLIQPDMLQVEGVGIAVVLKHYADGKTTAAIRCNPAYAIAADLAVHFGGGGHAYASGFKITDGRPINEVKSECIKVATELIDNLKQQDITHETLQHGNQAT
jgi:phosphoesterase RecJ-like protein